MVKLWLPASVTGDGDCNGDRRRLLIEVVLCDLPRLGCRHPPWSIRASDPPTWNRLPGRWEVFQRERHELTANTGPVPGNRSLRKTASQLAQSGTAIRFMYPTVECKPDLIGKVVPYEVDLSYKSDTCLIVEENSGKNCVDSLCLSSPLRGRSGRWATSQNTEIQVASRKVRPVLVLYLAQCDM